MPRVRKRRLTPEQLAAQAAEKRVQQRRAGFESVGLAPEAADLAQNQSVNVEQVQRPDPQAGVKGNEKRARRDDVFDALLRTTSKDREEEHRRRASLNAAHRLERDLLIRRGDGDRRAQERVDETPSTKDRTDTMIDAGRRVEAALSRIGRRDAELLCELIEPCRVITAASERWRVVVRLMTGEAHRNAQAARVRSACDNLAEAYRDIDHAPCAKAA